MKNFVLFVMLSWLVCSCGPLEDECENGYHKEGDVCLPDESTGCSDIECPQNSTCDDSTGVVECVCNEGFKINPLGFCVEDICQGTYIVLNEDDEDCVLLKACTEVSEDVSVLYSDLSDLTFLSSLEHIRRNLTIRDNDSLENLEGINSLKTVDGSVYIGLNDSLIDLNGLDSLKTVGDLNIDENGVLQDLEGLNQLETVTGSFYITLNKSLESLDGLQSLTSIGDSLYIGEVFDGVSDSDNNPALISIEGLSNVTHIENDIEIGENLLLKNLDGLENITSIEGRLAIDSNESLENLDGLINLQSIGEDLKIYNNPNLPCCEIQDLIQRLRDNGWEGEATTSFNYSDECGIC